MQRLEVKQKQTQKLKQQLRQSLAVLSMTGEDVVDMVERELLENPLLEKVTPANDEFESNWMSYKAAAPAPETDTLALIRATQSVFTLLEEQFSIVAANEQEKNVAEYIIGSLDDSGFLTVSTIEMLCDNFNIEIELLEVVRHKIINLVPGGFATKNVVEYLLWQIEESERDSASKELAKLILTEHIALLIDNDVDATMQMTAQPRELVMEIMSFIRSLSPRPTNTIANEAVVHVTPDIVIYKQEGEYLVALNPYFYPKLNIQADYRGNLESVDKETNKYLNTKMRAANFFQYCIMQREETMRNIAKTLVRLQREFLHSGLIDMRPLRLKDVAEIVEIHESTVSRAISGKYAQTPHGTIPLKQFFPSEIKTTGVSLTPAQIKQKIYELIKVSAKRPSDRTISEQLQAQGIVIARRTVAKYREQMGLK